MESDLFTGEMIVSPLSVASTVKGRRYNSEAIQRLLNGDQESSFVSGTSALEIHTDDSGKQQSTDVKTTSLTTPKQKPELPECLTGVKRIMKTPRQKAEPVEDIRGNLLKTPKQKKPEQQECLTGVKRIMKTPEQEAEPLEDIQAELLKTLKAAEGADVTLDVVKELETPAYTEESENLPEIKDMQESENLPEMMDMKTPNLMCSPLVCLSDMKRVMKTPREKSAPVEDMLGVKRLMKTPKEKGEPVEENFGIKRLMKSPRLKGNAPVEDFEGLQELMEEPLSNLTEPMETIEVIKKHQPFSIIYCKDNSCYHEFNMNNINIVY